MWKLIKNFILIQTRRLAHMHIKLIQFKRSNWIIINCLERQQIKNASFRQYCKDLLQCFWIMQSLRYHNWELETLRDGFILRLWRKELYWFSLRSSESIQSSWCSLLILFQLSLSYFGCLKRKLRFSLRKHEGVILQLVQIIDLAWLIKKKRWND